MLVGKIIGGIRESAFRLVQKKAELLHIGSIYVRPETTLPTPSHSNAGPGAGKDALHIEFSYKRYKMRVRLGISDDKNCIFMLEPSGNEFLITKHGKPFIRAVKILPKIAHSPTHAFITIDANCSYGCAFCNSAGLNAKMKTMDEILRLVDHSRRMRTDAVALTTGIAGSPGPSVDVMANVVSRIKTVYPDMTVGVEPYLEMKKDILKLKRAGASEIKLNIQSSDRSIFRKVCPKLNYDVILERISDAVMIFGRGKVCSNIIVGFGESDSSILACVEKLAKIGAVATVRRLSIDKNNAIRLKDALGHKPQPVTSLRLLRLARGQKRILKKHNLTTRSFRTMCHNCTCCDIEPFYDI